MDHDATWYRGKPRFSPGDILLHEDPAPRTERGTAAPKLSGHLYCIQTVAHISNCYPLVVSVVKPRLHDTTGCQTGCETGLTTGLTTGCIV